MAFFAQAEKKVTRAKMANNTNSKEGPSTTGAVKKSPKKLAAKPEYKFADDPELSAIEVTAGNGGVYPIRR